MSTPVSKLLGTREAVVRFGASVMLAAALVLAGCGGGEDTPDDVTPGDATGDAANDSNEDATPGDTPGDTTGDTTTDVTPGDTPDDVTPDECNPGYVLTSDGCVDIDECALNTHNCPEDALCKNTDGSFECECQPGFVWDGQDCKDEAKWVAVVHIGGGLGMLDTDNMVLHGPFLMGQLGQGLLTDIVVTPDGKTALIAASHPSPAFIRFVDISDVMNPALSNNLLLPMKPTDIAISADGKYALVAGYDSRIVVVDIEAKKIVDTFLSREGNHFTIEIAPDGTVVTTDDRAGQVSAFLLADNGKLSKITTHDLSAQMGVPLNVAIAPDGVTVMISGFTPYVENTPYSQLLAVFEITEPGELALKSVLYDIPRPVQSIAFDKAGKHAYMLGGKAGGLPVKKIQPNEAGYLYPNFAPDSPIPEDEMDLLMVANIKQPGVVTLDPSHFARLKRQSPSLNNGIESLVVRNDTAWVGYSTPWYVEEQAEIRSIASVDLKTFEVKRVPANGYMAGLARVPLNTTSVEPPSGTASCAGNCVEFAIYDNFTIGGISSNRQCLCEPGCKLWGDCCEDFDEVCETCNKEEDCSEEQHCVNTEDGKFECGCLKGTSANGNMCVLNDVCGSEGGDELCDQGATCQNSGTFAGYSCHCQPPLISDGLRGCMCKFGFELVGDTCEDVDECERGLHFCPEGTGCSNTIGGYGCML
ncbi:MAG TPA: EGF domain-containing protein [Myxococcota bacterium]|jgi:hypothetical protein|nr:EGF domain-containing protein [Myxococcota bacterium]